MIKENTEMMEQNKLHQLPEGWVWTRVGEIAILGAGNPAPQGKEYFENGIYPFVRVQDMGNLGNNVYIHDTRDHINIKAIDKMKLFPKGSVLFTKSGMSILLNQRAILGRDMFVVSHIGILIPLVGIPSEFVYYWLKTIDFKDLTHATTLPSLQLSKVHKIPFPLPPLPEQHRIVAKIEELWTRLEVGVEALKKVKAQIKRYRQAVLKYAFCGKLTESWRKAHKETLEPASLLLERIKDERKRNVKYKELPPIDTSNLPELPEGWAWTRVGEIGEIETGTTPSKSKSQYYSKDYPFYKPTDLNAGYYTKESEDGLSVEGIHHARLLPAMSILVTCIGATIGKTGLIRKEGASNQQINAIIAFNGILPEYIYWVCVSIQFQRSILDNASATTLPILNKRKFEILPFQLAPFHEQHRIVAEIERRFSIADEVEKVVEQSLKQAGRLRQSILKKAYEGRLVPQDPNDEPAEKLLERIKQEKAIQEGRKKRKNS